MLSLSPNPCTSSASAAQTKDSGITDVVSIAPARIAENSFRLFFANSFFFILFLPPNSCFLIRSYVFPTILYYIKGTKSKILSLKMKKFKIFYFFHRKNRHISSVTVSNTQIHFSPEALSDSFSLCEPDF